MNQNSSKIFFRSVNKSFFAGLAILIVAGYAIFSFYSFQSSFVEKSASAASNITKVGTNEANGSTTQAKQGDTIDWVVNYDNTTGSVQSPYILSDGIPTGTTYTSNSFKTPLPFNKEYSLDGLAFSSNQPAIAATVQKLKATGTNIPSPATGTVQSMSQPILQAVQTASPTDGDGFKPIIYSKTNVNNVTTTKVFVIYHHQRHTIAGQPQIYNINCVDVGTGGICANYPKYFSSQVGTSNTGAHDISTSFESESEIEGNKLYYAAQRDGDNGVGCWDMEIDVNCGYTQLGSVPRLPTGVTDVLTGATANNLWSSLSGISRVGNKLYHFGLDNKAYCYDVTSNSACPSQPYQVVTATDGVTQYNALGSATTQSYVVGSKIFYIYNNDGAAVSAQLVCFETLTNTKCAGGSNVIIPDNVRFFAAQTKSYSYNLFPYMNSANQTVGICTSGDITIAGNLVCYNINTLQSITPPSGFLSGITSPIGIKYSAIFNSTPVKNKLYVSLYPTGETTAGSSIQGGATYCYDFSSSSACSGFGVNGFREWFGQGVKSTDGLNGPQNYNSTYYRGCMFGVGNSGVLFTFNPETAATPCQVSSIDTTISPASDFYCDGKTHPAVYDKLKILDSYPNATAGTTNIIAKVYDKNGIFLKQGDILSTGQLSISDIPLGSNVTYNSITGLDTTSLQTSVFGYGNSSALQQMAGKRIGTFFTGDAPQICFSSKISILYDRPTLVNIASNPTNNSFATSNTFTVTQDFSTFGSLTNLTCTPNPVEASKTTNCSGTLPSDSTPPSSSTFKLNVSGQPQVPCTFASNTLGSSYTCVNLPVGTTLGTQPIQAAFDSNTPQSTDKSITVTTRAFTITDLGNSNILCNPDPATAGGKTTCSGKLPDYVIPPTDALKLNVENQLSKPCIFSSTIAGATFICTDLSVGDATGNKNIQGALGTATPANTGKVIGVNTRLITQDDLKNMSFSCGTNNSAVANSTTICKGTLPPGSSLDPANPLKLSISDATGLSDTCTADTTNVVTCLNVPTGSKLGSQPIKAKLGSGALTDTTQIVSIVARVITDNDLPFSGDSSDKDPFSSLKCGDNNTVTGPTSTCVGVLKDGWDLPNNFTLGLGTNPGGSCTKNNQTVTCINVPVTSSTGTNIPVKAQINTGPITDTGKKVTVIKVIAPTPRTGGFSFMEVLNVVLYASIFIIIASATSILFLKKAKVKIN